MLRLNSGSAIITGKTRNSDKEVNFVNWYIELVMILARLLRKTRRYLTCNYLGLFLGAAILAMALLIVCTTFLGSSEYLITRSDFVRNQLETFSNERLKKYTCDQRGNEPYVLRF